MVNLQDNPFFKVLFADQFNQGQVTVNWDSRKNEFPLDLRNQIDLFWQQEIIETRKSKFIFNGELCRLNDWRIKNNQLKLEFGLSNYKELLYSNQFTSENEEQFGHDSLSRAIGVSVVLISSDEQIILIKRSGVVGENPGDLDVLGGHIHPLENAVNGIPDPFAAIKAEMKEEVHLAFEDDV